ncbi:recombinase RecA [candidate division WOR-3 bacterium 4484_100]|uniref:Protein RecA n=1 Tax=candidate division WOR-3 bacterium 4484_100 TaxID=1936077 RepID=A0A1V4QGB0_UNCW3|nr:MAG: recombinase RecA [candidate division WOR-3 bacterium 4484_100]
MAKDDKEKVLNLAISQIEKQFGKGSIMRLGEKGAKVKVDVIPTGSLGLDYALGIGGFPRGRVVEIYGPEASGKTTLGLEAIAQAQRAGGTAIFVDAEHAFDPSYAQALGINLDELLISQPDTGEQALEIAEILTRSGGVDVVVVDSVAALVPKAEIAGEMGEMQVGLIARLMSQALRKLTGVISKSKTCAIFINQIRHKIGVMFGSPETTPGGLALKFHSSIRCDIRRISSIKKGDSIIGNRTKVKVVKNKLAPPFRTAEFDIIYGEGISRYGELIDLGVQHNILQKAGSWYSFGDERIGQGRDSAIEFLKSNKDVAQKVEKKLREILFGKSSDSEDKQDRTSKKA